PAGAEALDDGALALTHLCQIDAHGAVLHAIVGAAAGEVGDAGAGDHRLRGRAAIVDAGAADELAFEKGGLPAGAGQRQAERLATLSTADDDGVELLGRAHGDSSIATPAALCGR